MGFSLSDTEINPYLKLTPHVNDLRNRSAPFSSLSDSEKQTDWGREYLIGEQFGLELDLYRAITAFKRGLYLLPEDQQERRNQIDYLIMESYYLGGKYPEVLQTFETSDLNRVNPENFSPFRDLLIIVYDSYTKIGEEDKAEKVLKIIRSGDPTLAADLTLSKALARGDLSTIITDGKTREVVEHFIEEYQRGSKSPRLAQVLNAILPGAGYLYVGLLWSAFTSFLLNALFIAAVIYFVMQKNYAAALIFLSLEIGWYIGGINGAGLAAREWNENLYELLGKGMMVRQELFPFLMLETGY